jgi:hypothetical protein
MGRGVTERAREAIVMARLALVILAPVGPALQGGRENIYFCGKVSTAIKCGEVVYWLEYSSARVLRSSK